jgi:hypothetical protein
MIVINYQNTLWGPRCLLLRWFVRVDHHRPLRFIIGGGRVTRSDAFTYLLDRDRAQAASEGRRGIHELIEMRWHDIFFSSTHMKSSIPSRFVVSLHIPLDYLLPKHLKLLLLGLRSICELWPRDKRNRAIGGENLCWCQVFHPPSHCTHVIWCVYFFQGRSLGGKLVWRPGVGWIKLHSKFLETRIST